MTRSRYSKKESLNRIVRAMEGSPLTSDTPEVIPGEVLSEDEAFSDLAELVEGSLPSQTSTIPAALVATVAEANADTGLTNAHALTPASHAWAHEYGGIYVSTGTSSSPFQVLAATTWTKITGTFKGAMLDSGAEITCVPAQDKIYVNEIGTYFTAYQVCILNEGNAITLEMMAYENSLPQRQTRSYVQLGASGTVDASKTVVGMGHVAVAVTGQAVELYAYASAATTIQIAASQLNIIKMVG